MLARIKKSWLLLHMPSIVIASLRNAKVRCSPSRQENHKIKQLTWRGRGGAGGGDIGRVMLPPFETVMLGAYSTHDQSPGILRKPGRFCLCLGSTPELLGFLL